MVIAEMWMVINEAIEDFDYQLGGLLPILTDDDLLLITADHGNDPTWKGQIILVN